ncbi:MAG: branched-chain amino acid ABC transporter permease, partial [Clostridia bacterium]|nr:branched-chain amino acid ABC transporter permease [Clostridia bacterium]
MVKRKGLSSLVNLVCIVILFFVLQAVSKTSRSMNDLLLQIGYSIIMATSLNLACGYLGELPLGHAGFMSVGAYTAAVLTAKFLPQTAAFYPFALLCGGLMAALFAFIVGVPALRLKGDYLAIVTLGFGEIIRVLINTVFAPLTDGGKGLFGIPAYAGFADTFIITVICVSALYMLVRSRHGRATIAIRENAIAAEACGVNVSNYKIRMFVISAFFAGIAGGIYAHQLGVLTAA